MLKHGSQFLISLFLLSSLCFSQIEKGNNEINIAGNITFNKSSDEKLTYFMHVSASYGHFFLAFLEPGINFSITKSKSYAPFFSSSGFLSYYLPFALDSWAVPYLGGQAGFSYNTNDPSFIFGGYGGVKFILRGGHGAISLQPYYLGQNFDFGLVNNFGISTGISVVAVQQKVDKYLF